MFGDTKASVLESEAQQLPDASPPDACLNAILGLLRSLFRGSYAEEGTDTLIKREEVAARANLSGGGCICHRTGLKMFCLRQYGMGRESKREREMKKGGREKERELGKKRQMLGEKGIASHTTQLTCLARLVSVDPHC